MSALGGHGWGADLGVDLKPGGSFTSLSGGRDVAFLHQYLTVRSLVQHIVARVAWAGMAFAPVLPANWASASRTIFCIAVSPCTAQMPGS